MVSKLDTPSQGQRFRIIVAGICALILTVGVARFAYTPMLPIMSRQAHLSHLAGGWLAALNYAGYMGGTLLAASISDVMKKYVLYRASLVIAVLSTAAIGLTDNLLAWGLLRFFSGLASIGGMLLASGLVLNWLIRSGMRPELGLHFTGLGLGISLSGLVVATTSTSLRWDGQWLMLGAIGLVFSIPAWIWLPAPVNVCKTAATSESNAGLPSGKWMWLCILSYFCAGFGFAIGATFIVAILEKLPMLAGRGGFIWAGVGLAALPSTYVWDRIASAWGTVRALSVAYGLQLVSLVIPAFSEGLFTNLASAVLFGATFAGIVSLTLTLIGRRYPANPAKAMARMTLSYGIAQIVAPAMTGYLAQATGSYRDALLVSAFMMVIGLGLLRLLSAEESRSALFA